MRIFKISNQITNRENISLEKYLSEISKIPLLTADEEDELAGRISNSDKAALHELIQANLRFVVSVAKHYQNMGLSLSDLINEGNLGLIKAAERFDKTRGFKFISYAVWWIRQAILRSVAENSRIVRLPLNKIALQNKIKKAYNQLNQEFLIEPSIAEMADFLNINYDIVEDALSIINVQVSMDAPFCDDEENNLYHVLSDEDSLNPEAGLIINSLQREVERSLATLSEREEEIFRYYFGIKGNMAQSLAEIGNKFGLTRERVRQIKKTALKKLRSRKHSRHILKEYISC
jgi:RNA polymerase primary sigma factor